MNLAIIAGTLGRDAELKYTQGGIGILRFSVATSYKRKQNEEWVEETEWHRCILWGKRGEALAPYLQKGSKVCAQGRIKTSSWEDKDGAKKYTTEIIVNDITLQGGNPQNQGQQQGQGQQQRQQRPAQSAREQWGDGRPPEDDIPF